MGYQRRTWIILNPIEEIDFVDREIQSWLKDQVYDEVRCDDLLDVRKDPNSEELIPIVKTITVIYHPPDERRMTKEQFMELEQDFAEDVEHGQGDHQLMLNIEQARREHPDWAEEYRKEH